MDDKEKKSILNKKYYDENRERILRYKKMYRKLNPEKVKENKLRAIDRYPEKYKALVAIATAKLRKGLKSKPCEVCANEKSEAHHDNYNYKLSVRWLCRIHHLEFHKNHVYDKVNWIYHKK